MSTYDIEIRRTSYITLWVDAESKEQAEEKAWKEIEYDPVNDDASWEIHSIDGEQFEAGESK